MKKESGFTLLELLIVLALSGIVMAALYSAFVSQQRSYQMTEQVVAVQQNLRGAMFYMEREIRIAGYDPLRTNTFGITAISADSITLTMDFVTEDGLIGTGETITYAFDGANGTITRDAGGGAQVIAENVTGMTITGLDANGSVTATPGNVRSADLTVTGTLGGHTRTYTTRIRCRNMGL